MPPYIYARWSNPGYHPVKYEAVPLAEIPSQLFFRLAANEFAHIYIGESTPVSVEDNPVTRTRSYLVSASNISAKPFNWSNDCVRSK